MSLFKSIFTGCFIVSTSVVCISGCSASSTSTHSIGSLRGHIDKMDALSRLDSYRIMFDDLCKSFEAFEKDKKHIASEMEKIDSATTNWE